MTIMNTVIKVLEKNNYEGTISVLGLIVWNHGQMAVTNYHVKLNNKTVKSVYTYSNKDCHKIPEKHRKCMVSCCGRYLFDASPYGVDIFRDGVYYDTIVHNEQNKEEPRPYNEWHTEAAEKVGAEI